MYHAHIMLDGEPVRVLTGQTVASLLRARDISPERAVVELNGRVLSPREIKATAVGPGDVLKVGKSGARGGREKALTA